MGKLGGTRDLGGVGLGYSRRLLGGHDEPEFSVLFVCTGNICRSPMAEAIAWRELARYPDAVLRFSSAGSHALEGNPATSRAVAAAATLGADLEWHRARELTRRRVQDADLVLCMAQEHLAYAAAYDRSAADRTFLLAAWSRALAQVDRMAASPEELLAMAAKEVAEQPGDEVDDPIGLTDEAYVHCAQRLELLVPGVVRGLARVTS